jgi:hypothetical protein
MTTVKCSATWQSHTPFIYPEEEADELELECLREQELGYNEAYIG